MPKHPSSAQPIPADKVPCNDCGTPILPTTFAETRGFCRPCAKLGPAGRARRQTYTQAIADGTLFHPLPQERAGEANPLDFIPLTAPWPRHSDMPSAEIDATQDSASTIYLGTNAGFLLGLEVAGDHGVCTLMNGPDNPNPHFYYAYTPDNATAQITADAQILAGGPGIDAGMMCHPSRAHMPLTRAVAVFRAARLHNYSGAQWLAFHPDPLCEPGFG